MFSKLKSAITKAISDNIQFCVYRQPSSENIIFGADDGSDTPYKNEFIAVPFDIEHNNRTSVKCRITDIDNFLLSENLAEVNQYPITNANVTKSQYIKSIDNTIDYIKRGECKKIVYSNTQYHQHNKKPDDWADDFIALCNTYPNAFVFLFKTEDTNYWMGATPEIILCNANGNGETMSLAGTRKVNTAGPWGEKEIEEQNIVTDYIRMTIEQNKLEYSVSKTFTKNAGNIEHLCNRFQIRLYSPKATEELLGELHPTPAISGYPKQKAIEYLVNHEPHERKYYGGYCGLKTENNTFYYYVILRCIEFNNSEYCLYAGGGITADSNPDNEWEEINNKADTLKSIIKNKFHSL